MDGTDITEICPICGNKTLRNIIEEKEIPYFGKILIYTSICSSCGYRHNDVILLDQKRPVRIEFKASGKDDLSVRVIRSSKAKISIVELGIEIEPVTMGESFVSDIEGVLFRVLNILSQLLRDANENEKKIIYDKMKRIAHMRNGLEELTFIIEDPTGNSAIISDRAKVQYME